MEIKNEKLLKEGDAMDKQCGEAEGAQLLETMRKICDATGCEEVEHATLAYEEALQSKTMGLLQEELNRQTIDQRMS